jgi:hypothetical protein
MAGTEHESEAARVYRRLRGEVTARQVVAAAEDIVTDVWIDELELTRCSVLECADPVRRAHLAARQSLLRAQVLGDPGAIARAQARLSEVVDGQEADLEGLDLVLDALDTELERTCRAAAERARRRREDASRLRAACADACGG